MAKSNKHNLIKENSRTFFSLIFFILLFTFFNILEVNAQISFGSSGLSGESSNNPTSLQFGPDDRLYVSQQNGNIYAYTIVRNGPDDYEVTNTELIDLVKGIPNHNDNGSSSSNNNRQITGIFLTGTVSNPILYVSSSDPRIGAGGGGNDIGLDTNSGVLSKLECTGGINGSGQCAGWTKIDLVRGLPRSEENHAVNGIQINEVSNTLYLAVGGHTNAGSPSNNFAFTTEYALSACVVEIDLTTIESLSTKTDSEGTSYKYNLPTLQNVSKADLLANGNDHPDPWGGDDGLNQAMLDPNGPVQIFASGFRNLYDVVITQSGRVYGVDNGANGGWGGFPEYEESYDVTNNFISGEPGSTQVNNSSIGVGPDPATYPNTVTLHDGLNGTVASDGIPDDQVNNKNGLHLITKDYYGGHPAPIRANPNGAGLYYNGTFYGPGNSNLPASWPPVTVANPVEGDFQNSGVDDGTIANYGPSTNGIAEYTASNFNGAIQGYLLVASFNGNIYQVELNADGTVALNCPSNPINNCSISSASFASGFGSQPLDVIAQGDNDIFPGTVWAATYGADNITVFEPQDFGNCEGIDDDTIDEDGDGYTNADEIDNETNPCSAASQPADFDDVVEFNGFKRSDLNDIDDDNDGILDVDDAFCFDADNGLGEYGELPIRLDLFNSEGYGFGSLGFTGIMTNGVDDYFLLVEDAGDELVFGGTAGIYTDPSVGGGDAFTNVNTQKNGFQFPVRVDSNTGPFTILGQINGPYFNNAAPANFASHGIFMGTGDQDNYVKLTLRNNNGNVAFQVFFENGGSNASDQLINVPASILNESAIELYFSVDPATGVVQAKYATGGGQPINLGNPITLTGNLLTVVQGNYNIGGAASTLAVGTIATSTGAAPEFATSWDYFEVTVDPAETTAFVEVATGNINGSTFGNTSFNIENTASNGASITNVTFDLSSAIIPEVVFDPNGSAGDATFKGFTPNNGTDTATGVSGHTFTDAYEGGFYGLSIDFTSGQFTQNEVLQFGLDIDPISIKGGSAPGPNESGSVSGLELAGAKVTVTFDTGETWEVELVADITGDEGTSNVIVKNALLETPTISMEGVQNQSVTSDANQTITVNGPVGANVRLLQLEAGLFIEDLDGPNAGVGYDIDPWEVNSVILINEFTSTISNSFTADFNVALTDSDPEAGYNLFAAVVEDENGSSLVSNIIIVEFDVDLLPSEEIRINAGGAGYTDGNGDVWSADQFFVNGSAFPSGGPSGAAIANTTDDFLYQTERFNAALEYAIPVAGTGPYEVNLYFTELYFGAPGAGSEGGDGSRIFDVIIEGNTVISNYDIHAEVGALSAVIKSFSNINVIDGILNISLPASVNNGKISAIEVLSFEDNGGGPGGPIVVTPIPNQINNEGTESVVDVTATGGDGNLIYTAQGLPPGLDLEPTNGDIFGTIAPGAAANSPYNVTITVDDSDAETDDAQVIIFAWAVNPVVGGIEQVLYRVNAGGPILGAADGSSPDWAADEGNFGTEGNSTFLTANSTGGSTYAGTAGSAHPGSIIITDPSLGGFPEIPTNIFNTERFDAESIPEMLWQFPVEAGTQVEITLLFAELFGDITAANQRVFDVSVDGVVPPIFDDLDPYAIAGPKGAFVRSFVTTSDGIIDLEFIHGIENPALKGIQITALNFTGNLPPTIATISTQNSVEGEGINLQVSAVDDDNCGSFTFSASNLPPGLSIDSATGVINGTLETGTGGTGGVDGAFIEDSGLVIIEAETDFTETPGGWNLESGTPSFLVGSANNFGNATGGQVLTYNVQITTPGVYRFHMKSEFQGSNATEENDTWFKIDNTADVHFFCVQGGNLTSTAEFEGILGGGAGKTIYYPAGNAQGRPDHGNENAGSQGFFKIYRSGGGGNKWDGQTIDNNGFPVYAYFPNAGTFSIQMGERSAGHKVDRFALTQIDVVGTGEPVATLDGEQSTQVVGGSGGASVGSPYAVQVSVADNCSPPASSVLNFNWLVSPGQTGTGAAFLAVNPGGELDISTFGNNSFQLQNNGSVDITRLEIESSTGYMFDIVFDPVGTAGDNGAKCLTTGTAGNTAAEVGLTVPGDGGPDPEDCVDVFFNPHNGVNDEEGYDGLALDFTDFNPGELYAFGVDMDPTSIKGDLSTGDSGSVSGFELIGAKVTVFFANGQSYTSTLWDEGSLGGSNTTVTENTLVSPAISMAGLTTPTSTNVTNQNIAVTGTAGSTVLLLRVDARLHIDPGNPTVGYDVDPFEANEAMTKELYSVVLDGSGNGNIPVVLTKTLGINGQPDGGLNHFIAVTTDGNGVYSEASNIIVVELDDTLPGVPSALIEVTPETGLGSSTFGGSDKFIITNTSSGSVQITEVTIDLSTSILPDIIWDPVGSGGDATAQCFNAEPTLATAVGLVPFTDNCVDPFSVPREGGFDVLSMSFTDFNAAENFTFSVDIDPNSIQGVAGAGGAGSVSGYELTGATVTITFSDGSTIISNIYEDGSLGGGQTVVAPNPTVTPSISLAGLGSNPTTVNELNQIITVTGNPGDNVSLLQMDSRLFIQSGNPPFNVPDETYYANEAMSGKTLYAAVIGAGGTVDIPVTLLVTTGDPTGTQDGGLNQFIAVTSTIPYAVDQQVSQTSNVLTLLYDENFVPGDEVTISYALQGRTDLAADMEVAFYPVGSVTPTYEFTPTGSATGEVTLTGIAPGTYQLAVTSLKYLQVVQQVTVVEGSNTFNVGELLGGDANNDNAVTALDFSALATSFNLSSGDTGYNDGADFNGDGAVTALDFSILATNFNVSGQQPSE
ncbi:malectin domain-containing carbohydrate-binding protein [Croceitalea rosinachiae]|uniref:Malectin domain-containing carbohydrate-binding protein n=1 Tax=Croceitalea rosinachiae TaxID=3075596 RepID=A0ABU3AER5_9FLAO|nr:malectin domain-containing carbohydrate-binding protein [Croceitalea sp. F388]MDT0608489.1 malectin domain-containing carbohydrate-binding protein [Croceitalea sp. F388]